MSVKIYHPPTHSYTLVADKSKPMTGATANSAGSAGYVPAPQAGDDEKFLRGDGTWAEASGSTDPNKIGDVIGEMASSFGTTVSISWQDPENGDEITWGGTLVVRKAGDAPSSPEDGTTIVDNKVRNAYASSPYTDTGLSYGITYYYRFFPYSTDGDVTEGSYVSVTPSRKPITRTPSISQALIYNGSQQQIDIDNFDSDKMTVSGNTGTNAGSYTAVVTPKEGYCWSDGTYSGLSLSWDISKASISVPSTLSSYVYDGTTYNAIVSVYDHDAITVTGTASASEVGRYEYTMSLSDSNNYQWSDGTTAAITNTWQIIAGLVNEPLVFANLTYNGSPQSPTITRFDSGKIRIKQGGSATNAGTYTIVFELIDASNYAWSDGTTANKSQQWAIKRDTLSVPSVTSDLIYNGNTQNATISAYDSEKIFISGASGINARTYTATIQIIDKTNYMWDDGTDTDVQQTWTISKKGIPIPTVGSSAYYTGQVQYAVISEYDSNFVVITGTSAINAGTYTATKSLVDKDNTEWTNGETDDQYQDWVIRKAELSVPTVSSDLEYDGTTKTASVTAYDPTEISVTGITGVDAGTYYATIRILDKANYMWTNGTTTDVTQEWSISKKPITIPTVTSSLVYTGVLQSATVSSYDSTRVNVSGTSGINAGTYTATLSLVDGINCEWEDGTTLDKSVTWVIAKAELAVPTVSGSFTYDGTEKTATVSEYDPTKITVSGLTATSAGTHEAVLHLVDAVNYSWTDKTTTDKTQAWTIAKKSISAPSVTNTSKTYNGYSQSPTIASYDTDLISVSGNTATDAGNYTVVFTLLDPNNYQWASGTASSVSWSIARLTVTIPTISGSYTYDGTQKSAIITNNSNKVNITNTTAINAGTITCTMTLTDTTNYSWTDGTITAKTGTWTIAKKPISAPTVYNTSKTYNGSEQGPTIGYYDSSLIYVGGTTAATNAGTYYVRFYFVDSNNYQWENSSAATIEWTIAQIEVSAPSVSNTSKTYNGSSQGPTIGSYDSSKINVSGNTATNAGNYTVQFTLKDSTNYKWTSSSVTSVAWSIAKANGSVSVNKTSVSLTYSTTSASVTVSNPTGTVSISSSNTSVATVSPTSIGTSGGSFTITGKSSGSATIYISVAESTNYKAATNAKTVSVSVATKPTVKPWATATNQELNDIVDAYHDGVLTLSEIKAVWSVGDERTVTLGNDEILIEEGMPGINNETVKFVIMNFGGKTLSDGSTCLAVVGQKNALKDTGVMNGEITISTGKGVNAGGWDECDMESWCNYDYRNAVPEDFRSLFKQFNNITSKGSTGHSTPVTSADYFALPSEKEVFGSTTNANSTAESGNSKFEYYSSASRRTKTLGEGGSSTVWWLRSPKTGNSTSYCATSATGTSTYKDAATAWGVAPFGCI